MEELNYQFFRLFHLRKIYVFFYLTILLLLLSLSKGYGQWKVLTDGSVLPGGVNPQVMTTTGLASPGATSICSIVTEGSENYLYLNGYPAASGAGTVEFSLANLQSPAASLQMTIVFRSRAGQALLDNPSATVTNGRLIDFRLESGVFRDNFRCYRNNQFNLQYYQTDGNALQTGIDATAWHTYRILINNVSKTYNIYVDDVLTVSRTFVAGESGLSTSGRRIYFNKQSSTSVSTSTLIDYLVVDTTGAYAPGSGTALSFTDKTLSTIILSAGTLSPVFNASTLTYNAELPAGTTVVPTIIAKPAGASTVNITNATALPGSTTIKVTGLDGITSQTYTINFTLAIPLTPDAPTATNASDIGFDNFTANWNIATTGSPASTFLLDVATDAGFTLPVTGYVGRDVGNVNTFNVTGLSSSTTYYYRVTAKNSEGSSLASNVISATTGIPVSSISISGQGGTSTISTKFGNLQMIAAVLPDNAMDKSVEWKCINGTGEGIINSAGVLFASKNGSVTVVATAKDGSGVTAQKEIIFSNQPYYGELKVSTVSGAENIYVNGASEQMQSVFEPVNSSNPSISWSVINVTGMAEISGTGLLTAKRNGLVTVKAIPSDSSAIGTMSLVLYNQINTSINNIQSERIDIYPNPASRHISIYVHSKISRIDFFSDKGVLIKTYAGADVTGEIDISTLSQGLYIVRAYAQNGTLFMRKFVKQ